MTDKITPIGNGYAPIDPPPSVSDIADLKMMVAVLLDEMELLSKRVTQLTRVNREFEKQLTALTSKLTG